MFVWILQMLMINDSFLWVIVCIPCESIKMQHFLIVCCLQNRAWIWANVTWLARVILSNYFDTTFEEYCFTDDVTGAGIVTERKIPCANFYMVSEWETRLKKQMTQSFDMVSFGVFVCCLFIHGKMIHKMVSKIIAKIYSITPYHIHRYLPSNIKTMNHWKVLRFNWLTLYMYIVYVSMYVCSFFCCVYICLYFWNTRIYMYIFVLLFKLEWN